MNKKLAIVLVFIQVNSLAAERSRARRPVYLQGRREIYTEDTNYNLFEKTVVAGLVVALVIAPLVMRSGEE